MPTLFDLAAILMVLSGTLGYLNKRYVRLPSNAGLLVLALVSSILVIVVSHFVPDLTFTRQIRETIGSINFNETLMEGMLGFLLFAGALHVDWQALKSRSLSVGLMATLGVLLSTLISGAGFYYLCRFAGIPLGFDWALVFGALISPTDPVAVLATLKTMAGVPKRLEIDMAGESLFNDGVGVVVFTILLASATGGHGSEGIDYVVAFKDFVTEAIGGAAFGAITGYVAYRMMLKIDDYPVETLISIGLVMGTYAGAHSLGMSGPIAVVVAGLLIGERGVTYAMSDTTQRYLHGFWTLVDDILNAVLFMLIGLEFLVIDFDWTHVLVALAAIPLLLFSRLASVYLPFQIVRLREQFSHGIVAVLTWGGIRGGISVALALSLPNGTERDIIVTATYAIVVFAVLVQGITLPSLVRRMVTGGSKSGAASEKGRVEQAAG